MFANVVYLILGFIIGFLIAIILAPGGRAELEAEIASLQGQNQMLRKMTEPDENPEKAYEQDKEPE